MRNDSSGHLAQPNRVRDSPLFHRIQEFRFAKDAKWQDNTGLLGARVDSRPFGSCPENRPRRYPDCL
jgi:hypothetical protein